MKKINKTFKNIITAERIIALIFLLVISFFCVKNMPTVLNSFSYLINENFREIQYSINSLNSEYDPAFYKKDLFLNVNGLSHRLLNQKMMNHVVKLNNGYLSMADVKKDVSKQAENIIRFNKFLKKKGIPSVYVQIPYKINKNDNQLPVGISDYKNDNADRFIARISQNGLKTFDLREEIVADGLDHYSMFFKTDHHWKIETAFWAYAKTINLLNKDFGFKIDRKLIDIKNYKTKTYKQKFIGYYASRTGTTYAGLDDISLIIPEFKTNLLLSIPSKNEFRKGDFSEAIFDKAILNAYKDMQYYESLYHVYIGITADPIVKIKNLVSKSGKKVLLLKDSYALPIESFMSLCFKEIIALDMRYYNDKAITEYIDEIKPDIVIFLYGAEHLTNKDRESDFDMFEFFGR